MKENSLVRDYENPSLPLNRRVSSLARRFDGLAQADGLHPWDTATFHQWVTAQPEGSSNWHTGHFILNLFGTGPWDSFDILSAIKTWSEADKDLFARWVKGWR